VLRLIGSCRLVAAMERPALEDEGADRVRVREPCVKVGPDPRLRVPRSRESALLRYNQCLGALPGRRVAE
jgi:hypothetical protein